MFYSKKGVSLITVLMFMLVATIAGTATFKWLTSENRSSASRMLRQDANQSSLAGINNARAWMSNHANEMGAIIKQYFDNGNRPIHLNSVLQQLNRDGQDYDVWLTGVSVEDNNYKIKLISKGNARKGTAHTEAAILNIDGLYRIKIPQRDAKITFDKAFHGASEGITGNDTLGSGNIIGNWAYSNTPAVRGNMIVTGNTEYGGSVSHYGDFYLAGNMKNISGPTTYGKPGLDTAAIYIGGNVSCPEGQPITVNGDLFVKGDISEHCKIDVKGNLTIGGHVIRGDNNYSIYVGKNWVFTNQNKAPTEQLELKKTQNYGAYNQTNFRVGRNLYLPYKIKAYCGEPANQKNCGDINGKRGFTVGKNVYQYYGSSFVLNTQNTNRNWGEWGVSWTTDGRNHHFGTYMDNYTRPFNNKDFCTSDVTNCSGARFFSFDADSIPDERVQTWSETDNVLKKLSDPNDAHDYWEQIKKLKNYGKLIDSTTKKIPDPILLKDTTKWMSAKANSYCGISASFAFNDDMVDKLNKCYTKAKEANKLYNDFLIIEWKYKENGTIYKNLEGKFVFHVTNEIGNTDLPPTSNGSIVFLYLTKGTRGNGEGQLKGHHKDRRLTYNYLLYSKGDIKEINNFHFKGSVVMADGKKLNKYQGNNNLEYDGTVLKALTEAGFIKENPEYTKLNEEDIDDIEEVLNNSLYDSHYIAISSQLGITLESQYETRETVRTSGNNAAVEIAPSAIILPRVIYLTRNPTGKLSDYYSLVHLNTPKGTAKERFNSSNVSCNPSLNTSGMLYQNNVLLTSDVYTCNYQSNAYGDLPFYVVVSNETGKLPKVNLTDSIAEITTDGSVTISAKVESSTRADPINIDISISRSPDGWTVTPATGVTMHQRSNADIEQVYELTLMPSVPHINLFTVTANSSARPGSIYFSLRTPTVGCLITAPSIQRVYMIGSVTIVRQSIDEYCSKDAENAAICQSKGYDTKTTAPDCELPYEWVRAVGTNVNVQEVNNKWIGSTNTAISLQGVNTIPDYCELILPQENNTILRASANEEHALYASLKKKQYTLTVKKESVEGTLDYNTSVSVWAGDTKDSYTDITSSCTTNAQDDLICKVYAGQYVKTTYTVAGTDEFSRWECTGDNCTDHYNVFQYELKPITANNTVVAKFNLDDTHCFYEDFSSLTAFCYGSDKKCIRDCEGGINYSCTVTENAADWQLMYPNNGNGANIPPVIQDGYITSSNGLKNGNSTIILSTKKAGIHGTMTTLIQTSILEDKNRSLNAGFIFSADANANSFTILNIFGDASNNNALTARVCEGNKSANTVNNLNCMDTVFVGYNSNTVSINSQTMIKLEIELTLQNKIKITATVNDRESTTELDISSFLASRDEHSHYVGFNISDPSFKIYDIAWSSKDFADECFDDPRISCSFKANYLGGIVPKDKDVKPWVGFSSWFEMHDCTLSYYYNGCDNATGNSSIGCTGNRFNWINWTSFLNEYDSGNFFGATLNDDTYNFSTDGLHGTTVTTPFGPSTINDAKVKISCSGQTSLNGKWASCGSFQVGDIVQCSKNAEILNSTSTAKYGAAGSELEIPVDNVDGTINLREASLLINISNFTENNNDRITVYLKDSDNNLSAPREINSNGTQSFSVELMSDVDSFNPESVKSIIFKSNYYPYQVNTIMSSCPYALGISNCRASYNGISWYFSSTITNMEGAAINGCSIKQVGALKESLSDVSCPMDGSFIIEDKWLYNSVNASGQPLERTYEIKAKNKDGSEVSCLTNTVTITPIMITDCKLVQHGPENKDYKFTADVTPASDGSEWSLQLVIFDYMGNIIKREPRTPKKGTGAYSFDQAIPTADLRAGSYSARLFLHESAVAGCYDSFVVTGSGSSSSTASSSSKTISSSSAIQSSSNAVSSSSIQKIHVTCPGATNNYIIDQQNPSDPIPVDARTNPPCTYNQCRFEVIDIASGLTKENANTAPFIFYDNGTGTKDYKLRVVHSTSGAKDSCNFKVKFKEIRSSSSVQSSSSVRSSSSVARSSASATTSVTMKYYCNNNTCSKEEYTFKPNTTYVVICDKNYGNEASLVCKTTDNTSHTFSYGGTTATANPDYWGASATCLSTPTQLTTTKTIKCKNDY